MSQNVLKALLIEENPEDAVRILEIFKKDTDSGLNIKIRHINRLPPGIGALPNGIDLILLGLSGSGNDELNTLKMIHTKSPQIPVILLGNDNDESFEITGIRNGAQDYLIKGQMDIRGIRRSIQYSVERKRFAKEEKMLNFQKTSDVETDYFFTVYIKNGRPTKKAYRSNIDDLTGNIEEIKSITHIFDQIVMDEDHEIIQKVESLLISGHKSPPVEYRIRREDGEFIWVRGTFFPYYNTKKGLVYYNVMMCDITEKIKAKHDIKLLQRLSIFYLRELDLLFRISKISENYNLTQGEIFQRIVKLIPTALQYPDICNARLVYNNREYKSKNFIKNEWGFCTDIRIEDKKYGFIEVYYTEVQPGEAECPFLEEEKESLKIISNIVGMIAKRIEVVDDLKKNSIIHEMMIDGVILTDLEGRITEINNSLIKLIGYSKDAIIGKNPVEIFIDEKYHSIFLQDIKVVQSKKSVRSSEYPIRDKKGKESIISVNLSLITDGKNNPTGLIIVARDITENIKMQQVLKEREERFRAMIESGSDVILIIDVKGVINYISPSVERELGYTMGELLGVNVYDLLAPDERKGLLLDFNNMIKNPDVLINGEHKFKNKDGSYKYFDTIAKNFLNNPSVSGIVFNAHNITERKKNENDLTNFKEQLKERINKRTAELVKINDELVNEVYERKLTEKELTRARQEAEKSSRSKSEFLANMSHELRTPLNSIIGFSKLMKMGFDSESYDEHVDNIISSGVHLLRLINDILDLSKIEAGKMKFEKNPVDLNNIISTCISQVSVLAVDKKIEIINNVKVKCEIEITGDERMLNQVFINLLNNALKFSTNGSQIKLISKLNKNFVEVHVIDNGVGIKKENQGYIFEKFSQVETRLDRSTEGTGLGLAITKEIIGVHNGTISLKSAEGKGSTFIVALPYLKPLVKRDLSKKLKKNPYPFWIKEKCILVVDDDKKNRDLLFYYFKFNNQRYSVAKSGEESIEYIEKGQIDLVLMDIKMKGMDGIEAMKIIKSKCDVPVIAVTAHAMNGDDKEFIKDGFDGYLSKPLDLDRLIQILEEHL